MVAKEMSLRPLQEESELQDFDDEAETLSLCDLPLYSCASDWDDLSKEDQNLGTSFDQDFFEFFSGDFTASTCPSDNIIFCGKLIPYKGETVEEKAESLAGSTTKEKNSKKSFRFHWKPSSFNKSRTAPPKQVQQKSDRTLQVPLSENHGLATRKKCDDKIGIPMKKVSILATPIKPRWYFSAFGVGRFPTEMELSDIKTRQNKKSTPSKMFQSEEGIEKSSKKRGKGLWSLLRDLGQSSHHSSTALAN